MIPREGSLALERQRVADERRQPPVPSVRILPYKRFGIDLEKFGGNPLGQPDMPIGLPEASALPIGALGVYPKNQRVSFDAHRNRPRIVDVGREMHQPPPHRTQSHALNGA